VPVVPITTGRACHLDAAMVSGGLKLLKQRLDPASLDLLWVENVGNLVCPAEFEVGEHRKVALLSVTEGDDKPLKYPVMFREAHCVLITKTDLLPYLPIGIAMGTNPVICRLLEPLMGLIRYMPAPAFIPLLIIYFGLDELPKVLLISIGTFFFNTLMIMDAVKFVPRELVETARTLGGRTLPILTRVVAPFIAPEVLDTYRINMASAWNLVIVAELVAATEGLGKRISLAQRFLRTDEIFMGVIVIGLIGLLIDLGFRALMRRACSWAN